MGCCPSTPQNSTSRQSQPVAYNTNGNSAGLGNTRQAAGNKSGKTAFVAVSSEDVKSLSNSAPKVKSSAKQTATATTLSAKDPAGQSEAQLTVEEMGKKLLGLLKEGREITLYYFDVRARAEYIRILLAAGGVNYTDARVAQADWPELKPSKLGFF